MCLRPPRRTSRRSLGAWVSKDAARVGGDGHFYECGAGQLERELWNMPTGSSGGGDGSGGAMGPSAGDTVAKLSLAVQRACRALLKLLDSSVKKRVSWRVRLDEG